MTLSLTDWLSQSLTVLLLLTYKERPYRLVIFDQSDEEPWPKNLPTHIPTYPPTYLPTYLSTYLREHPQGAMVAFMTFDQSDEVTWPNQSQSQPTYYLPTLQYWLKYWQLRTWINDNFCYLAINWIRKKNLFQSSRWQQKLCFVYCWSKSKPELNKQHLFYNCKVSRWHCQQM